MDDPPMFDLAYLAQLICQDGAALASVLAHLHRSNREDLHCLDGMENDPERLGALAHRIKGAARIARIEIIVEICERIEHGCSAQAGTAQSLRCDVQALREAMQRLDRQLSHQAALDGLVRARSYHSEQQQHQQHHEHSTDDTRRAVTPAARVGEDR